MMEDAVSLGAVTLLGVLEQGPTAPSTSPSSSRCCGWLESSSAQAWPPSAGCSICTDVCATSGDTLRLRRDGWLRSTSAPRFCGF